MSSPLSPVIADIYMNSSDINFEYEFSNRNKTLKKRNVVDQICR